MTKQPADKWGDTDMELLLSKLLRYGVLVASAIVVAGCIVFLVKYGNTAPEYGKFTGEPEQFKNVFDIVSSTLSMSGRGLIEFGLLVLISIPVLRVGFSVVSFAIEKDKTYVYITLVVLVLLLFSLFGQH